jgi:hypothetical protein
MYRRAGYWGARNPPQHIPPPGTAAINTTYILDNTRPQKHISALLFFFCLLCSLRRLPSHLSRATCSTAQAQVSSGSTATGSEVNENACEKTSTDCCPEAPYVERPRTHATEGDRGNEQAPAKCAECNIPPGRCPSPVKP